MKLSAYDIFILREDVEVKNFQELIQGLEVITGKLNFKLEEEFSLPDVGEKEVVSLSGVDEKFSKIKIVITSHEGDKLEAEVDNVMDFSLAEDIIGKLVEK